VPLRIHPDPILPPVRSVKETVSFAATEFCPWRRRLLEGEVHDENAYCLGGVGAHAGLFGTLRAVFRILDFLWNVHEGTFSAAPWFPEVVREFWERKGKVPHGTWALGFDTPTPGQSSAGSRFGPRSIGHLGFTGTSFWMDPDRGILVICYQIECILPGKMIRFKPFVRCYTIRRWRCMKSSGDYKTIYLMGIGGIAMGTLAAMLKEYGCEVMGSDQNLYPP